MSYVVHILIGHKMVNLKIILSSTNRVSRKLVASSSSARVKLHDSTYYHRNSTGDSHDFPCTDKYQIW